MKIEHEQDQNYRKMNSNKTNNTRYQNYPNHKMIPKDKIFELYKARNTT